MYSRKIFLNQLNLSIRFKDNVQQKYDTALLA